MMMLNAHTRQSLTDMLGRSLADCVTSLGGVRPLPVGAWPPVERSDNCRLVVLTLSGYCFQSLVCVLADSSQATRAADFDAEDDRLKELANNVCGTFKRSLSRFFPELGMSTPNRLQVDCLRYLSTADTSSSPDHSHSPLAVHCIDSNGVALHISLMFQSGGEFELPDIQTDDARVDVLGELELF